MQFLEYFCRKLLYFIKDELRHTCPPPQLSQRLEVQLRTGKTEQVEACLCGTLYRRVTRRNGSEIRREYVEVTDEDLAPTPHLRAV